MHLAQVELGESFIGECKVLLIDGVGLGSTLLYLVGSLDLLKPVEDTEVASLGYVPLVELDAHILDRLVEGMIVPVVQLASTVDA